MFTALKSSNRKQQNSRRTARGTPRIEGLESRQMLSAAPTLWADDANGKLFTVNVGTGAVHVVGQMPTVMFDIAFDPSGHLYGVDSRSDLWRINSTNASATDVGALGTFVNSLVFSTSGKLYGAGSALYTINTSTGHATEVGTQHLNGYISAGDLAFDSAGTLYLSTTSDQLVRVSTSTGGAALVGSLGFNEVYGMAYGPDHVLYGLSNTTEQIFSINLSTGHGTLLSNFVGKGVSGVNGSTFITEAVATPSIEIDGLGQKIADGEASPSSSNNTAYGTVTLGAGTTHTFVLKNNTKSTLFLTGSPRVNISGLNPGDFTVVSNPASSVAPGGSTTFCIKFSPKAAGTRLAEVTVDNTNATDGAYHFEIRGTGATPQAAGTTIYATDSIGELYTVNSATGAVHNIGQMATVMYDLAFSPTGALYGIDSQDDLWRINATTAAISEIGKIGVNDNINSLTFSASGWLYAAGTHLYAIDLSTNTFYDRGSLGGYASAGDLAFDKYGRLLMSTTSNDIIVVNPSTAAVAKIGAMGFSDVLGLAESNGGVMYGMSNATDQIFTINLLTGQGSSAVHFNDPYGDYGATVDPV